MKTNTLKVVVGHGSGLRPTKKEMERTKIREQYRIDLDKAREKYGNWIPFGYNLDKLPRNGEITKSSVMVSKRVYITLPEELIERVEKYNEKHPCAPISYSGACKKALEDALCSDEGSASIVRQ